MSKAKLAKVSVKLPWLEGEWIADEAQQQAAWEMYVELITRVAVQPLSEKEGILREALSSFYQLFGETRRILKAYGPSIASPLKPGALTFGQLAVDILNRSLRPLLAEWHPRLAEYEHTKPAELSQVAHEKAWAEYQDLRAAVEARRKELHSYASLLADICGVSPLHDL